MTDKYKRVVVGMSGGVDSSATAAILLEQGYEVMGLTISSIKVKDGCKPDKDNKSCCTYQSSVDAHDVSDKLGIEHYMIDLSAAFKEQIIDDFVNEYLAGRTPNPCVKCNPAIKWEYLLQKADALNAYWVATGHYANVEHTENGRSKLIRGADKTKDQTYFLWKISQEQLQRTMFPIGKLIKSETRQIAQDHDMAVANKPDSQEVCFIPDNDYRNFLRSAIPDIDDKIGEGHVILNGKIIGKHKGYPFYTIGQRKGLGISHPEPLFVKDILPESNTIVVCLESELNNRALIASDVNIIADVDLSVPTRYLVKVRYRDAGSYGMCSIDSSGKLFVEFEEDKKSITPGQSVVMYDGEEVIGGAIIEKRL